MSDVKGAKEWYLYTPAATEESPTPAETLLFTNEYDEYGELVKTTAGENEETYTYNATGKLTHYTGNGITETYTYNNKGQLSQIVYTGTVGRTETREYTDDSRGLLERISYGDVACWKTYDKYGRLQYQGVEINGCYDVSDIKYKTVNNHETNQVREFRNSVDCFTYTYDKNGNITEIYNWGTLIKRYWYDDENRLSGEEDVKAGKQTFYIYSHQGNIKEKQIAYPNKKPAVLLPITYNYTYSTDGKYLMTSYRGQACEYDSYGNPTTYKGKTLVWGQGKRLLSYDGLAFEYDAFGRRTKKGSTNYYYDSQGRLVKAGAFEFYYAGNEVIAFSYGVAKYIYCKDVFGNITAILDGSGTVVVKYDYDAWGNHRVLNGAGAVITDTQHIGHKNPFRYRGYYYDSETGLYYLKSRYYDPETCRFINMDSVEYADPTYLHGLNLYAYCNNNPIMYVDPSGHAPEWIHVLAIGLAIIGAVLAVGAITVLTCGVGTLAGTMAGAVIHGAAQGIAIGSAVGVVGGGIVGGIASDWSAEGILIGTGIGLGAGAIVGGVIGGLAGASSFTANGAYISQYGGNVKEVLSAYKGNPRLKVLNSNTTAYRTWGGASGKYGHWISPKNYGSAARSMLSLPPVNAALNTSEFLISKGTTVLSGKAAALFNQTGGGIQWWIGVL